MGRITRQDSGRLVGIDGGGTTTRALCCDMVGSPLGYAESGGSNPSHNAQSESNVREALMNAVKNAGCSLQDVVSVSAGLSGYDSLEELKTAREIFKIPGLNAKINVINDAIVAHAGGLGFGPGILTIAGGGAITIYIDEQRNIVRNYDFNHYSRAASRHIGYAAVHALLIHEISENDKPLLDAALSHFGIETTQQLRIQASKNCDGDHNALFRQHGLFAPVVTCEAEKGSPIAVSVCARAAEEIVDAILLTAPKPISNKPLNVVLHGGVASCNYFRDTIVKRLMISDPNRFKVVYPKLTPIAGAVLLSAVEVGGLDLSVITENLSRSGYAGSAS
jgi:glucosamine kinase